MVFPWHVTARVWSSHGLRAVDPVGTSFLFMSDGLDGEGLTEGPRETVTRGPFVAFGCLSSTRMRKATVAGTWTTVAFCPWLLSCCACWSRAASWRLTRGAPAGTEGPTYFGMVFPQGSGATITASSGLCLGCAAGVTCLVRRRRGRTVGILRFMSVTLRIDWDQAAIHQLLYGESGLVRRKVREVTENVADRCRVLAPNRDGTLRASIKTAVRVSGTKVVGHVYSDLEYSVYVQRGTGIYGPVGRPIRPRRSPMLVFDVGGRTVFARQVRGTPPQPFMLEALRAGSPWPVVALPA